jgi:hypothetical protein
MQRREFLLSSSSSLALLSTYSMAFAEGPIDIPHLNSTDMELYETEVIDDDGVAPGGDQAGLADEITEKITDSRAIYKWYENKFPAKSFSNEIFDAGPSDDSDTYNLLALGYLAEGEHAFEISVSDVEKLFSQNNFKFLEEEKLVLFGIRGLSLRNNEDELVWRDRAQVITTRVNYQDFRCLLGVFDREARKLSLFKGSTVPNYASIYGFAHGRSGANLLPAGKYAYQVSRHPVGRLKRFSQPGAFGFKGVHFVRSGVQQLGVNAVFVQRTLDDYQFSLNNEFDLWHLCNPGDNLHAGVYGYGLNSGNKSEFSSAGCQTVKGAYTLTDTREFSWEPVGPWSGFRRAAGLSDPIGKRSEHAKRSDDDGKYFSYVLLTADDFRFAALQPDVFEANYQVARLGSEGERVANFQRTLKTDSDGRFGTGTLLAWFRNRQENNLRLTTNVGV